MARKPRIHFPGACYHVILRGNAGQDVFFSDQDRSRFCFLLQEGVERYRHRILAYCLMTNHIHLIIQVDEIPLSRIIQNLSFRYTRFINYQKKQFGHLFQGRYKAILIDIDSYLLELIRYLHTNPVRAGIVKTPERYIWSSHTAYLKKISVPWLSMTPVLSQFASTEQKAIALYHKFIQTETDDKSPIMFQKGNFEGRILGTDRFIEEALAKAEQNPSNKVTLSQVLSVICTQYSIKLKDLKSNSRQRQLTEPRAVAALVVREVPHLRLADLSRKIGRDLSGLSQAAGRLEQKLKDDSQLSNTIDKIKITLS